MSDHALIELPSLMAGEEPAEAGAAGIREGFTLAWHHPDDFDAAYAAADQRRRRRDPYERATDTAPDRVSRMWDGHSITLQHHERPTIGAHRLWMGVAVVARAFVYAWYDERGMPHREYGHGPEARLVRGLCYGCGWDRIEHVAPEFRRGKRIEGHTWRSAADLITARFEEHAAKAGG